MREQQRRKKKREGERKKKEEIRKELRTKINVFIHINYTSVYINIIDLIQLIYV